MAEGPLIRLICDEISGAMKGETIQDVFTRSKQASRSPGLKSVVGSILVKVDHMGKNIILKLSNGYSFRIHLMMFGRCEVYQRGEKHRGQAERIRLSLKTSKHELVVFSAPVVQLLGKEELAHHPVLSTLGPDAMTQPFESKLFLTNLRKPESSSRSIGETLLDQRVVSGVGNIYKSEILFLARINPETSVSSLIDLQVKSVAHLTPKVLHEAYSKMKRGQRVGFKVYGRSGRTCIRCGSTISSFRQMPSNRITYFCPNCQGGPSILSVSSRYSS